MDRNVDVYELLDQFVSYLSQLSIAVASVELYIAVASVKLYIAAVRSFLEFSDVDIMQSKFKRRVRAKILSRSRRTIKSCRY